MRYICGTHKLVVFIVECHFQIQINIFVGNAARRLLTSTSSASTLSLSSFSIPPQLSFDTSRSLPQKRRRGIRKFSNSPKYRFRKTSNVQLIPVIECEHSSRCVYAIIGVTVKQNHLARREYGATRGTRFVVVVVISVANLLYKKKARLRFKNS